MVYYLLALAIIIADQFTKWLIAAYMEIGESIPIIEDVLHITSHRNAGAAFGILQGQMWLFFIVTIIVTVGVIYFMQKMGRTSLWIGMPLGILLGGTIGNFIDRVLHGEVIDFIDVYIGTYSFPIFNVADSALTVGVILLIGKLFIDERREKKEKKANES
ncbi:lipoprotein signal peptidase [Salicibibacter halophilus]|uniref:Lipoprotein signal peptidase n=1 Tax=Salicibibacter halophilus TaxID=2502791 RepID=A0A514LMA6_9BACI|nr:signal peptidase II [Salicibibacter halophilus]QDI93000.1 lipoprotein signal peptidase [Salicibibacter halophilus]